MLAILVVVCAAKGATAKVDLRWSGKLQSDIRFRIGDVKSGDWYSQLTLPAGVSRNENIFKLKLEVEAGRFLGVADVDLVWTGYSAAPESFNELFLREKIDPFRIEAHAAFIEIPNLFLDGLDLRIGQQVVAWGVGDQFNPTNTLNALDLEDPLLFGEQLGNMMVRVDYNPWGDWIVSGVLVPIFKPALLPPSAQLGPTDPTRLPFVDPAFKHRVQAEQALSKALGFPAVVSKLLPVLPETSVGNMQFAFRLAGVLGGQDVALSYYYGRTDIPQPWLNYSYTAPADGVCRSVDGGSEECLNGITKVETFLGYPRMQMAGLNIAGEVDLFGWMSKKIKAIGYRLELGVFFPQEATMILLQEELDYGGIKLPAGEYDYRLGGKRPQVVEDRPFAKWTLGLDYTFNRNFYLNVQWVHGFPDEYGAGDFFHEGFSTIRGDVTSRNAAYTLSCAMADKPAGMKCAREFMRPRLGDYLVLGSDIKLLNDSLLIRLFLIVDLTGIYEESWDTGVDERVRKHHNPFSSEGFSMVIFPEITYNLGSGVELSSGALIKLGNSNTKFGDPAAGGSELWTRARFSF